MLSKLHFNFNKPRTGFDIRLMLAILFSARLANLFGTDHDWPNVGGDKGCTRYSSLDQITRKNVNHLQVAWTYHTGDAGKATTIECTPIVVGGLMFLTTAGSKVAALD